MTPRARQLTTQTLEYVMVVAVANYYGDDLFDWAAYIGPTEWGEEEIAAQGCKLMRDQAAVFFASGLYPLEKYRL